jgi:hypothetical protein
VAITKLPGIVACTGAVVVASENSNPEAILTLRLRSLVMRHVCGSAKQGVRAVSCRAFIKRFSGSELGS